MTKQAQYSIGSVTTFEGPEGVPLKSGVLKEDGKVVARWRESVSGSPTYCEFESNEAQSAFGQWAVGFHSNVSMFGSIHYLDQAAQAEEDQRISKTIDGLLERTAFVKRARKLTHDNALAYHLRPTRPGIGCGRSFTIPGRYYGPSEINEVRQSTQVPDGFELIFLNELLNQPVLTHEAAAELREAHLENTRSAQFAVRCQTKTVLKLKQADGSVGYATIDRQYRASHEDRLLKDYGTKLVEIVNKRFP